MLIIKYDPDSEDAVVLPDTHVEQYVADVILSIGKEILENRNPVIGPHHIIVVGNELIIMYFRVAITERKLQHYQIIFTYGRGDDEISINPDKDGRLPVWPQGFCDCWDDALDRLLDIH